MYTHVMHILYIHVCTNIRTCAFFSQFCTQNISLRKEWEPTAVRSVTKVNAFLFPLIRVTFRWAPSSSLGPCAQLKQQLRPGAAQVVHVGPFTRGPQQPSTENLTQQRDATLVFFDEPQLAALVASYPMLSTSTDHN